MTTNATDVVIGLGSARKAIQLYPPSHPAFGEAMDTLVTAVDGATAQGPFVLNLHLGRLYDGSVVISEDIHGIDSVAETLESRRIESLTFSHGFSRDDGVGLIEVLSLKPNDSLDVEAELAARNVHGVAITFLARGEEGDGSPEDRTRRQDRALHSRLVTTVRTMSEQLTAGSAPDLSQTTPVVEGMLERMMEDQAAVIGLATIRSRDERVLFHALSVMIYTVALGQQLKLPEDGLLRLATSALLHDIGKSVFDLSDPLQAEVSVKMHPRVGAEILQRLVLDDPGPMLVAYEHHLTPDGTGFPECAADYIAHPYSRMVAVADRYENLTNPHEPAPTFTPDRAVVQLLREAGTSLDPFFARAFVAALGVFPIGCVVRLSDQSVGVVCRPGEDPLAPFVKLTYDERGTEYDEGPEIDLGQGFVRIVEIVPAEALNLEVSDAL
jgi:HD-GYP domain-containing protein (c-di-GMP phosphodiesterase class II)